MAGHSKWANIKFKKAANDAKRGKIFTKLIREITVAARMGGEDVSANPRLRAAIDNALSNNMKRDTIDKAVKRGVGVGEGENYEEITYEGYGPNGLAVMVFCLTDNRNRTVAEVRHAFSKCGGEMGTAGSVAYLFTKQGCLTFPAGCDEEKIMEISLDAGAEDIITNEDGSIDVVTTPENYLSVKEALLAAEIKAEQGEVTYVASTEVELDKEGAEKMIRLIDMLEDLDDVQNVYSNGSVADDIVAELS